MVSFTFRCVSASVGVPIEKYVETRSGGRKWFIPTWYPRWKLLVRLLAACRNNFKDPRHGRPRPLTLGEPARPDDTTKNICVNLSYFH
jgi:hypothetical protein